MFFVGWVRGVGSLFSDMFINYATAYRSAALLLAVRA